MKKKCERCKNPFFSNPIIQGDNVCKTCDRMNCITFWYPRLSTLKFPTPKTIIIHTEVNLELFAYGEQVEGIDKLVDDIKSAALELGLPVFLRSGYTSNKHAWKNSCFVDNLDKLKKNIFSIAELSAVATPDRFMPCDFWVVRELLKTKPLFKFFHGEMPITKERRFFIKNGKIKCHHSYWPDDVFEGKIDKKIITELNKLSKEDTDILTKMATYIAGMFSGLWSGGFLKTEDGKWYLTDMAIGESSYHQEHDLELNK